MTVAQALQAKEEFELMSKDLKDIAEKYGFKPHIWSDMFFRLINNGGYYGRGLQYEKDSRISEKVFY